MNAVTRILIVHESPLLRDCLTSVLSAEPSLEAIPFDHQRDDWEVNLSKVRPEVLIIDLGLSALRANRLISALHRTQPAAAVIALVSDLVERDVVDAVTAGATVCVPKNASLEELRLAIGHAVRGESYCSPLIANSVLAQLGELIRSTDWTERADDAVLSVREREVLRLIAESDLSNKQIARQLCLSLYTVKNHVHNILEKLSVGNRHAAVEYARERAWI